MSVPWLHFWFEYGRVENVRVCGEEILLFHYCIHIFSRVIKQQLKYF